MTELNSEITFSTRDEYGRASIAKKIIQLLESDITISPMIIDGDWGTGKTEFCYKLINQLKSEDENARVIYVDAFKSDHSDEPIMMILAAIIKLLPEREKSKLIEKALPALRFGLKTIFKTGAHWVLKKNTDDFANEFKDAIKDTSNAAIDGTIEALLQDHVDAEKNISLLQDTLKKSSEDKKLFIFIDELDRCRPNFAISILENIKHVFDVENVKFILITNTQQLHASINKSYGYSVDAKRYLDKFIKFTCVLPQSYKNQYNEHVPISEKHFSFLSATNPTLNNFRRFAGRITSQLICKVGLSLREVETFSRYIEIYQITSNDPIDVGLPDLDIALIVLSIYLYCFHKNIANEISEGIINIDDVSSAVKLSKIDWKLPSENEQIVFVIYAIYDEDKSDCKIFSSPTPEQKRSWDSALYSFSQQQLRRFSFKDKMIKIIKDIQLLSR